MKTYTINLTAGELETIAEYGINLDKQPKFRRAYELSKADKENDDLLLPWRYEALPRGPHVLWSPTGGAVIRSEVMAKLMSAAPELLKAVQEFNRIVIQGWHKPDWASTEREIVPLINRALRKVDTGIPE